MSRDAPSPVLRQPGIDIAPQFWLVMIPGLLFVCLTIYFVMPALPPITAVSGCYKMERGPTIKVSQARLIVLYPGQRARAITVHKGKPGYEIEVEGGTVFASTGTTGDVIPTEDRWTNSLIGVVFRSNKPPALELLVDDHVVEVPKVKCAA